jgi:hypothetical protein
MDGSRSHPINAAPRVEGAKARVEGAKAPAAEAVRRALHKPGRLRPDGERCPACQSAVRGRFCSTCGEKAPHRQPRTTWEFLKRGVARLLDADSRLLRSLSLLLFRPGALTNRFLDGHRSHYVGPLQLFAIVNVAFVVFVSVTGGPTTFRNGLYYHLTASYPHEAVAQQWVSRHIDAPEGWALKSALALEDSLQENTSAVATAPEEIPRPALEALSRYRDYAERFDRQAGQLAEALVFLFIPALAALFWGGAAVAGTPAGRRGLASIVLASIVQATHFMTAFLVLLASASIFVLGIDSLLHVVGASEPEGSGLFVLVALGSATVYLSLSIRRVGEASWPRSIAQSVVVVWPLLFMQRMYTAILFFVAYVLTL